MTPAQKQLAVRACESWREMTDGTGLVVQDHPTITDTNVHLIAHGSFPSGVEWRCSMVCAWETLRTSFKAVLHQLLRKANQAAMTAACATDFKPNKRKK